MNVAWPKLYSIATLIVGAASTGAVTYLTQQCPAFADWRSVLPAMGTAALWGVVHLYQQKPQKQSDDKSLDVTIIPK